MAISRSQAHEHAPRPVPPPTTIAVVAPLSPATLPLPGSAATEPSPQVMPGALPHPPPTIEVTPVAGEERRAGDGTILGGGGAPRVFGEGQPRPAQRFFAPPAPPGTAPPATAAATARAAVPRAPPMPPSFFENAGPQRSSLLFSLSLQTLRRSKLIFPLPPFTPTQQP